MKDWLKSLFVAPVEIADIGPNAFKLGVSEMLEANHLVNGDRQADYGSPADSYRDIAKMWTGLLGRKLARDITAEEAALMMVALKLQRQTQRPKRDNLVDAHGYLLVASHCSPSER